MQTVPLTGLTLGVRKGDADRVKTPVGFPDIHAGDMLSHGTYLR